MFRAMRGNSVRERAGLGLIWKERVAAEGRALSRHSAASRAIPGTRMLHEILLSNDLAS